MVNKMDIIGISTFKSYALIDFVSVCVHTSGPVRHILHLFSFLSDTSVGHMLRIFVIIVGHI